MDIIYYLEFVTLCQDMESWSTFVQLPIRRRLLKTRIHLKERSSPIYLGHIYQRLHHRHLDQLPACYTKLTVHRNMKFTNSQPLQAHYNPNSLFTSANKNLTQFVKVLLVKLTDMLHSSNFVRLFHHQSFTLYGSVWVNAIMHIYICNFYLMHTILLGLTKFDVIMAWLTFMVNC